MMKRAQLYAAKGKGDGYDDWGDNWGDNWGDGWGGGWSSCDGDGYSGDGWGDGWNSSGDGRSRSCPNWEWALAVEEE